MPKRKKDEVKIPFSIGVDTAFAELIDSEALRLDRSRSWVAGKLLLRGWTAYKQDGLLDEPKEVPNLTRKPSRAA